MEVGILPSATRYLASPPRERAGEGATIEESSEKSEVVIGGGDGGPARRLRGLGFLEDVLQNGRKAQTVEPVLDGGRLGSSI